MEGRFGEEKCVTCEQPADWTPHCPFLISKILQGVQEDTASEVYVLSIRHQDTDRPRSTPLTMPFCFYSSFHKQCSKGCKKTQRARFTPSQSSAPRPQPASSFSSLLPSHWLQQ